MTVTANDTTPDFGQVVELTISGHTETPNAATVNGVAESLGGPATSSYAEVTMPPGADFSADADHQYTPLGENIQITLSFPTEADDSVTVQITPSTPYTLTTAGNQPYPNGTSHPAGTVVGDKFLWRVTSGTLGSIGANGVVSAIAVPLVVERFWFPDALEMWSAKSTLTFQFVDYPAVPMLRPQIVPFGESVITRATVTGALRTIDLGAADTFRITLTHPLIEAADVQLLMDFWDANRGASFSLTTGGNTYDCRLDERPRQRAASRAPLRWDVTSQITAVLSG